MKTSETKIASVASHTKANQSFFSRKAAAGFLGKSDSEQTFFHSTYRYPINANGILQTKRSIGEPNDKYEKEADAMSDKVMQRMTIQEPSVKNETIGSPNFLSNILSPFVQNKCAGCQKEKQVQAKRNPSSEGTVSHSIESRLRSSKGSGYSIPAETKKEMENSFGADFSNVRIHTDITAVQMNKDLNAQAFTHGNDIYFNAAKYAPNSTGGKHLLAHELTHTIQQGAGLKQEMKLKSKSNRNDPGLPAIGPCKMQIGAFREQGAGVMGDIMHHPHNYSVQNKNVIMCQDAEGDEEVPADHLDSFTEHADEILSAINPFQYCQLNCPATADAFENYVRTGVISPAHCDRDAELRGTMGYSISEGFSRRYPVNHPNGDRRLRLRRQFVSAVRRRLHSHGDVMVVEAERSEEQMEGLSEYHFFVIVRIRDQIFIVDAYSRTVTSIDDLNSYLDGVRVSFLRYTSREFTADPIGTERYPLRRKPESDQSLKNIPQGVMQMKSELHGLTPVIQQNPCNNKIQREPDDHHDLTAVSLSGDPILEKTFDNETTISTFRNSRGSHVRKIQEGLIQLEIPLAKFGADEQYGTETSNGVKDFQQKAGMTGPQEWDGIVGRKTIGLLDRSLRNGTIEKDTDAAKEDFKTFDEEKKVDDEACKGKATDKVCPDPNDKVNSAADEAIKMIDKVLDEQLPPVKNEKANYPAIFEKIFRNNDTRDMSFKVTEVISIFEQIKKFIEKLKTDKKLTRCATDCDGGCRSGSPAYHTPTKEGGHIITFCPDFNKDKDRILIVIHESHHAAIPGSSDKAYADTRLFEKLDHKTALLNAASFHVYAAWVDKPGSAPIGQEVKDTNMINDASQKETTDLALAHLNQWFRLIPFDTSQTVQGVEEANQTGVYSRNNPRVFMELVFSKWFGLTAPPARPTNIDVQKIKAIDERMNIMEDVFEKPFVIVETPNASFWERGPGTGIALNQNTLNLDVHHLIIALLQELVHAVPNISAESEPLYVGTINDMRNLRDLDP